MAKNIVICSDGTGNTTITGRGTNVFKLFEAIDLNGHRWDPTEKPQVAFYDDGVGSQNFKPLRLLGGAAGWGLSENVRQLYKELARVYDHNDQIYVFGFSRGAFTVRTLVGFIATCGLVDPKQSATASAFDALVKKAYAAYRQCYRTPLAKVLLGDPGRNVGEQFKQKYSRKEETRIRFVGVWDTVDAVGLPFHLSDVINQAIHRFKFPDPYLSTCVDTACHALCVDDERASFAPVVWNESRLGDRIEQVWFPGVHSNVGGGYPKQGLSLIALDWMMARAEQCGLRFNEFDRSLYRDHLSVDDKLYDPRAGLGAFYRWKPRDIAGICAGHAMTPKIHVSLIERIAHGADNYAPANLPGKIKVVTTPPAAGQNSLLIDQRAANVEKVVNGMFAGGQTLLASLGGTVGLGRFSYYLFVATCVGVALAVLWGSVPDHRPWPLLVGAGKLTGGLLSSPFDTVANAVRTLLAMPFTTIGLLLGFLLSSILSRVSDRRMSDAASSLWYRHQEDLRDALKVAREQSSTHHRIRT